jgi:hypothetical protein
VSDTDDVERSIVHRGCVLREDPALPGFRRFFSADPRFPISIAYPAGHEPFYDFNRPDDLAAEFHDCFTLTCQDIRLDARSINLVRYVKEDFERRQRLMESANRFAGERLFSPGRLVKVYHKGNETVVVGSGLGAFRAPRLVWDTGEMSFFPGPPRRSCLWSVRRIFGEIGDADFATVLASLAWLPPEWFDRLPARFRA